MSNYNSKSRNCNNISGVINTTHFFLIPKKMVLDKTWAKFPQASKKTYPAILVHCDKKTGLCNPSQKTIGILSGQDVKTVRSGIKGLKENLAQSKFYITKKPTSKGYLETHYYSQLLRKSDPQSQKGTVIFFYDYVIRSGIWSLLTPSASAVYLVIRTIARFPSFNEVAELDADFAELDWQNPENNNDIYMNREYDVFEYEPEIICEHAGIDLSSLKSAIACLNSNRLIDVFCEDENKYKIYLRSKPNEQGYYFPANALIQKSKIKENYRQINQNFGRF